MSAYPATLRSVLKAVPVILMCMGMSSLVWLGMHGLVRHSQDHIPRHSFRSTRFQRLLRFRDDKKRLKYTPNLNYNPNLI